jgi:hypothetical protein
VGWTGLVNNLVIEELLGLSLWQHQSEGHWRTTPNFPPQASGLKLGITFPEPISIEIKLEVRPDRSVRGGGIFSGEKFEFDILSGDSAPLPPMY